jgi:putative spermidine/putrescine transport system ATP-binding protein
MDEPLSNLDAKLRLEMRAEIRRIHNTLGATTIYVTHDQEEALSLADRIVVLRDGEVRQVGTPEDLFARPDHLDVAEFMGFRNRLTGVAGAVTGGRATVESEGARIAGIVRGSVQPGARATAVVRPDDFHPVAQGGLSATVAAAEFRGREFVGFARTAGGAELAFRSDRRVAAGETVSLGADPDRVLIYGASE